MLTEAKREVPQQALKFSADVQIGKQDAKGGNAPISIVARTGDVVSHWYWGRVVHDLAGMTVGKERIPFDYCHCDDDVLGYGDQFDIKTGDLVVSGLLIPYPTNPEDKAAEVLFRYSQGIPYEGSIFFAEDQLVIEEVPEGMTAQANGKTFQGPVTIFRQWQLRGVAICPYGTDSNTSLNGLAGDRKAKVQFTRKNAMSIETPAAAPAAAPPEGTPAPEAKTTETPAVEPKKEEKPGTPPAADPAAPPAATVPAASTSLSAKTGKDFLTAFGSQGGVWFAEGRTWDEAQGLHQKFQADETSRRKAENSDLKTKLSAGGGRGEKSPLSFSNGDPDPNAPKSPVKNTAGLSENLNKFAASLKVGDKK